ncbi:unnamed protein product [Nesidiocoris tenuis]|uniref:ABC-type glutathione-S-conjugate transporter n=1 Tax=Nesidiocoris tenuis TaxID=355587 RepID=A0A6H5GVT4_9HEMI|nr:unnamed protein product [Nesidiocoris tenuis]
MAENSTTVFCPSEFWNSNLTWYTETPRFTACFEETVLAWVPCLFLVVFLPCDIYTSLNSKARNIPWNWKSISKIVFCSICFAANVLDFFHPLKEFFNGKSVVLVAFLTPILRAFAISICVVLILFHRLKGIRTSGVACLFWFLVLICGVPQVSSVIRSSDESLRWHDFAFLVFYLSSCIVFVIHFFADDEPLESDYPKSKSPCPEGGASFFSKLAFAWFDSLAMLGYKRPLVNSDLWDLRHEDMAAQVFPAFNKNWQATLKKNKSKTMVSFDGKNGVLMGDAGRKVSKPSSILPALIKTFGPSFIGGSFLKLVQDLLAFVSPQILKLLISFVEGDEPIWKGYLFAVLLMVTASVQTIFLAQYFNRMIVIGLRVRTALISTIYRKALRLSNSARKESTVGEIVNLMSVDAQRFMDLTTYLNLVWSAPMQIALALFFLWQTLGPSVLAGLAVMIIMIPVNGVVANKMKTLQIKQMKNKDERVKMMNEILSGIKVLKLYAWEPSFEQQVIKIRNKEIKVLRESAYFGAATSFIWSCAPFLVSLVTFAVYVLVDERNVLDAKTAFVSLSLFNLLRFPLSMLPMMISNVIQAGVSIKRINKFLNGEELDPNAVSHNEKEDDAIVIKKGSFRWEATDDVNGEAEPILSEIDLKIKPHSLVAVVGVVGSGKSSLLSALLGEMEKLSGHVNVNGSVAYVSQTAWIQNATLQDNILFGKDLHKRNYLRVVEACALKPDFEMLPGGDQTEIGEKGINLSGGQKQRVSLARAVYHDADIYYLDDPLSAVDSHVGKHIFENVIGPKGLLHNKTRVLVTHSITHLSEVDIVIVLKDGKISEMGTYKELVDRKGAFAEFLSTHLQEIKEEEIEDLDEELKRKLLEHSPEKLLRQLSAVSAQSNNSLSRKQSGGGSQRSLNEIGEKKKNEKDRLIEDERAETGGVKLSVYKHYLGAIGPLFVTATIVLNIVFQGFAIGSNIWLSVWSSDETIYVNGTQDSSKRDMYLEVYGLLGLGQITGQVASNITMALGGIQACVALHLILLSQIFHAPLSFFDITPSGRVLSRLGKDTDVVDGRLAQTLHMALGRVTSVHEREKG